MIINLGCASVDNHIPRDDIFDYHPRRECNIYIISEMYNVACKASNASNMILLDFHQLVTWQVSTFDGIFAWYNQQTSLMTLIYIGDAFCFNDS